MSLKVVLVLASMLSTADFLKCYSCSDTQKNCSNIENCQDGNGSCTSSKVEILGQSVVTKGCGSAAVCATSGNVGGLEKSCCQEDLCNGASSFTSLQCYSCGFSQKDCGSIEICQEGNSYCTSSKMEFFGQSMVTKGCGSTTLCGTSVNVEGLELSCCQEDLCNGASNFASNTLLFLLFLLIFLFF